MTTKVPKRLTRKTLTKLTGAKPYQVYYLTTIGKLPLLHEANERGDANVYHPDAIAILKNWLMDRSID